jgi:hypothetical protein
VGKVGEEYFLLSADEIYAFQAEGDLVWIVTAKRKYLATAQSSALVNSRGTARSRQRRCWILRPASAIAGATVEIQNPSVSHYDKIGADRRNQGNFEFDNVPTRNNYHLSARRCGRFQGGANRMSTCARRSRSRQPRKRSPISSEDRLKIGGFQSVTVTGGRRSGRNRFHHPHRRRSGSMFDKLPLESQSSSLSSLVTLASPGVSADSNGLFTAWAIMPRTRSPGRPADYGPAKQGLLQSNPVDAVQSMEVIEGAPPAEYGDKTSLVIVVTTRSGLGVTSRTAISRLPTAPLALPTEGFDLAYGKTKVGQLHLRQRLDTGRFWIPPSSRFSRSRQRREYFRSRRFQAFRPDSINSTSALRAPGSRLPILRRANRDAWSGLVVNNGGLGPNGLPVGSHRSALARSERSTSRPPGRDCSIRTPCYVRRFARQDQYNYYPSDNPFADLTPDLQLADHRARIAG